MSVLSDKYGITDDTVKKMIKDGVISCSWNVYDQVIKMKNDGKSIDDIAHSTGYSVRRIYGILKMK